MATKLIDLELNDPCDEYIIISNPVKTTPASAASTMQRWRELTKGYLDNLSWKNYIVAGGAVWRCISGNVNNSCDIDFFVYGETVEDRAEAVLELLQHFSGYEFELCGSVITINAPRPIQIICSAAETPLDVLNSFDLSHLQVCFIKDRLLATPNAEWSIHTSQTIMLSKTKVERIHKAYSHGLAILYKLGQEFTDQYNVLHPMTKYVPRAEPSIQQKLAPQLTTTSVALALNTAKLDAVFQSVLPYNTVRSPLDYQLLDLSKLELNTIDLNESGYVKVNFLKYNEKDLLIRTCPLKLCSISEDCGYIMVEIQDELFRTLIEKITKKYTDTIISNKIKLHYSNLPTTIGNVFTGVISMRFSRMRRKRPTHKHSHKEYFWKFILHDYSLIFDNLASTSEDESEDSWIEIVEAASDDSYLLSE